MRGEVLFVLSSQRSPFSFSSLLLSSLLSFVSFDENVPFEKKDDGNAHKYNYNAAQRSRLTRDNNKNTTPSL